ncbi:MAG TPA: 1,4-alpha-glucan branching protein domain-containing protein [Gemmataceae bacterium]|nr:1,4-alpha-glucan branching protein domain-containing protein [Gemmataceae bacterium]
MPLGYLCLVLHAHLPFVRHPEYDDFLEEDWLYEAITETYIPLLEVFDGLERDNADWRLTMSVTPTLAAMLSDPLLQYRYVRHLDNLIALACKEVERTRWQPEFHVLAQMYHTRFLRAREVFVTQYSNNLLNGFRRFFEAGKLELITCGATHGFLPLMTVNGNAIRAQIELGCREFERHFGRRPQGIWLPECGYAQGLEHVLQDSGLRYFFTDTHGVLHAEPRPRYGVYAPILCADTNVAALARDTESSKQVWSAIEGYPGDYHYREFYRDVGFDLDYEYLRPHLHHSGIRSHLGIKYYRITGRTDTKEVYKIACAQAKAAEHAGNFMFNREKQVEWLAGAMDRPPLIVAPYDAELFGHWWFEGPDWINYLLRKMHWDQQTVKPITVPEYLDGHPRLQVAQPSLSSWGHKGYAEVWLEGSNDWIYRHLHEDAERMVELARQYKDTDQPLRRRALNQAARELLLAQSSDWAFIMKTGTMVEYARERTRIHVLNFNQLYEQIKHDKVDEPWLSEIERRHNLFPDLDYRVYV